MKTILISSILVLFTFLACSKNSGDEDSDSGPKPDINLKVGSADLANNGSFSFPDTQSAQSNSVTLTIENLGASNLVIDGLITLSGTDAADFSITQPSTDRIVPNSSITFAVAFNPASKGSKTAALKIQSNDPDEATYTLTASGNATSRLVNPTMASVGDYHSCALDANGVICWGATSEPPLANHDYGQTNVPALSSPTAVSAGGYHTCALDSTGVVCWGRNNLGQTTVPALSSPTQISSGWYHNCAVDSTGVVCWGSNTDGKATVPALTSPTSVVAGQVHTCAIDGNNVICWGSNTYAQSANAVLVNPYGLVLGPRNTCSKDDNGMTCWGDDSASKVTAAPTTANYHVAFTIVNGIGINSSENLCWGVCTSVYTPSSILTSITQMEAFKFSGQHGCAVNGTEVVCWGQDAWQQSSVP